MPSSLSYSKVSNPIFFIGVVMEEHLHAGILKKMTSYEEWKSVLHLSPRWNFGSIRKLALNSIEPPTPHDRLVLARTYLIDDWVVPALSALCERTTPLTLSEARQLNIEDVVLVSTVREHIRGRTIQVDAAKITLRVEAEQLIALGHRMSPSPSRESEDDTPMATPWHSRSLWEKAEAEARSKAQEATGLQLDADAEERAEAEENARQEVEKARQEAEKVRKDAEKARLEAEKARKDAEEKARLEVEKNCRKDAEDEARAKKAWELARKREAKAKAAEAEATRQAGVEVEKMKLEAEAKSRQEAKAAKEELEAKAKAEGARIKANEDAVDKAKPEEEATQWRGGWRVNERERPKLDGLVRPQYE